MYDNQIKNVNSMLQKLTTALARPGCWWELQDDGRWKFIRSTCPQGCTCNEPLFMRRERHRPEIEGSKVEVSGEFRGTVSLDFPGREGAVPHSNHFDLEDIRKAHLNVFVVVDGNAGTFTPCICPEDSKSEE